MKINGFFKAQQEGMKALATTGVIGLHMVSGPAVGFGLGYLIDWWAGTSPWFGFGLLLTGIGAGFLNVWRDTRELVQKLEKEKPAGRASVKNEHFQ